LIDRLIVDVSTLKNKNSRPLIDEYEISTNSITPAPFTEYEFDEDRGGK